MNTATELAMMGQEREAKDQMIFEHMMEDFFKVWAPDDKYEMARFHAELSSLIRRVYIDAQAPLAKQITAMMAAMPMPPLFVPSDRGK
jgi:hypothetical protein